jgi:hypothetical protein
MTKTSVLNFLFRYQRDPQRRASAVEIIGDGNKSSALFPASKSREMAANEGTKSAPDGEIAALRATG